MIVFYFQCRNYVNYNRGNNEMITVIMNSPNLHMRFIMTTSRETQFTDLFRAYFGFTVSVLRAKNKLSIQFVYSCRMPSTARSYMSYEVYNILFMCN